MSIRRIRWIFLSFVLCFLVILALYLISENHARLLQGFSRRLRQELIAPANSLTLNFNSYYIAGASSDCIYLGNSTSPSHILKVRVDLLDSASFTLHCLDTIRLYKTAMLTVDTSSLYVADGIGGKIIKIELKDNFIDTLINVPPFLEALPTGDGTYVFRRITNSSSFLENSDSRDSLDGHVRYILDTQVGGVFDSDGLMSRDLENNTIIFIYYYRNKFFKFNSDLKVLLHGKTIDTTSTTKIKLAYLDSQITTETNLTPTNRAVCLSGNYLFVESNLHADNEDRNKTLINSVIDVYDSKTGSYQFSFYMPHLDGVKMDGFYIYKRMLYAMYGNKIKSFKLLI